MGGPLVIGPRTATAGTVLAYTVPAETHAIYVQNYSKLTLLVSFGDRQPAATDSLNNQYDGVLAPGGRDTFYVQSRGASVTERSLNAMGAFTGKVWIMPVDRTGGQANTGTLSTVSDVWLSAYGPYDPAPPFTGGMPMNVDLSSQPRVVMVPMALDFFSFFTGRIGTPAGAARAQISPNIGLGAVIPTSMVFYLYQCVLTPGYNATGAGGMDCIVELDCLTSGLVSVGAPFPITLLRQSLWWAAAAGPYDKLDWKSNYPLGIGMSPPANAAYLAVFMHNSGSTNIPPQFDYMIGLGTDTSNTNIVPGLIGSPNAGHLF